MKARASPNIAFIKYWGKLPTQGDQNRNLATNPSLSMTLSKAYTETSVEILKSGPHEIIINGQRASPKDEKKVADHLQRVCEELHQSPRFFRVESHNNFPQGTGLASSASAFAALTLATFAELSGTRTFDSLPTERLSALARRGSGSASRSLTGPFVKWSGDSAFRFESDWELYDTIVIFSDEHKKVPSTEGHQAATSSPLFARRLETLPERMKRVEQALKEKDLARLGAEIELEALELHRIAETGLPPVHYLLPQTQSFLEALKKRSTRDFYFTLDAGPNVHLISERPVTSDVQQILDDLHLSARIWEDRAGIGPRLLANNEVLE